MLQHQLGLEHFNSRRKVESTSCRCASEWADC